MPTGDYSNVLRDTDRSYLTVTNGGGGAVVVAGGSVEF